MEKKKEKNKERPNKIFKRGEGEPPTKVRAVDWNFRGEGNEGDKRGVGGKTRKKLHRFFTKASSLEKQGNGSSSSEENWNFEKY